MITVDQAFELVAKHVFRLQSKKVDLQDALGQVLSSDVLSDIDSPPFDKSMMDGYAVAESDSSSVRYIIERIMAGDVPEKPLATGSVSQVMTGAPVPEGAVAVVPVEKTHELDPERVRLEVVDLPFGKHIQPKGSLLSVGGKVMPAGTKITPHAMAALAEAGAAEVEVVTRPRVSILITGNELVEAESKPGPGQIRNSNGPMLSALVKKSHCTPSTLPRATDELNQLTDLVSTGLSADVLLITGGVSAGVKDLVPQALSAAGVEQVFHKVSLKPGKPLWFGVASSSSGSPRLVFGLPGNPVSGLVCFHLFVRPALKMLAGRSQDFGHEWLEVEVSGGYSHPPGRELFRPAQLDEAGLVHWCSWQGSADLAGTAKANCLVRLPGTGIELESGQKATILRI